MRGNLWNRLLARCWKQLCRNFSSPPHSLTLAISSGPSLRGGSPSACSTRPAARFSQTYGRSFVRSLALWLCISALGFWPSPSWPNPFFPDRYDAEIREATHRYWGDFPFWRAWKAQLYQESLLNPAAVSPVGARGLAQFMPATWAEVSRQLGYAGVGPHSTKHAIAAGAFYMAKLRATWRAERPQLERQRLAQASYNAGTGNILKAQRRCHDRRLWAEIAPCLREVTGERNAHETTTYVARIARWWEMMELAR